MSIAKWIPDLTASQISGAINFDIYPYNSQSTSNGWDNAGVYSTNADNAGIYDLFKINLKKGATYDIYTTSFWGPDNISIYDSSGKAIYALVYANYLGYGWLSGFVAPYTGNFYVDASWNQGSVSSLKNVSLTIGNL